MYSGFITSSNLLTIVFSQLVFCTYYCYEFYWDWLKYFVLLCPLWLLFACRILLFYLLFTPLQILYWTLALLHNQDTIGYRPSRECICDTIYHKISVLSSQTRLCIPQDSLNPSAITQARKSLWVTYFVSVCLLNYITNNIHLTIFNNVLS